MNDVPNGPPSPSQENRKPASDMLAAPKLASALRQLLDAYRYAEDAQCSFWDFAVEISTLRTLGLTNTDLRWFVRKQYVEHRREVTDVQDNGREFRSTGDLSFSPTSCFVLTQRGVAIASRYASDHQQKAVEPKKPAANGNGSNGNNSNHLCPRWDHEKRHLTLGQRTVKQFKWRAANQEMILAAFEEEGWPARIDDPLPPHDEQDPKRRLSDAIKCLNRKQLYPAIRFRGDGTGEGVIWEQKTTFDV
ncbi:MAG: hypothetical protein KDB27_23655 [Planctomycetales bacterium]|nr:hypothetical protein [Planctomycetales bacterium]